MSCFAKVCLPKICEAKIGIRRDVLCSSLLWLVLHCGRFASLRFASLRSRVNEICLSPQDLPPKVCLGKIFFLQVRSAKTVYFGLINGFSFLHSFQAITPFSKIAMWSLFAIFIQERYYVWNSFKILYDFSCKAAQDAYFALKQQRIAKVET